MPAIFSVKAPVPLFVVLLLIFTAFPAWGRQLEVTEVWSGQDLFDLELGTVSG